MSALQRYLFVGHGPNHLENMLYCSNLVFLGLVQGGTFEFCCDVYGRNPSWKGLNHRQGICRGRGAHYYALLGGSWSSFFPPSCIVR
jgi:hypothetical protein